MDDMNWTLPPELESALEDYHSAPQPDPAFASRLDLELRRRFDKSASPFGGIMQTLRARPLVVILIALLILLALSGMVYALGRSLGYIPGLGVVDQNTPIHVLAEPVSQTRDGVTVTVEKAVMNADNVLIVYKVEGLTPDKFSFLEPLNTCMSVEELRFPGGEFVKPSGGVSSNPMDGGFENTNKYGPVPAGTTDATLFIPCINGALSPGILPENWELPLRFVPAPPDVASTMMPVIEITPAPDAGAANPLTLTRIIDAGDSYRMIFGENFRHSYVLFGEFNPPAPSQPGEWRIERVALDLVDNNGQTIYWQYPYDIDQPVSDSPHKDVWAIVIEGFAPPLHITETARYAFPSNSQETYTFEFDAGANPQPLQEWNLNKEFQFAGHTIRLTRISANPVRTGYVFSFETDDTSVNSLSARIDGYPSIDHFLLPILLPGSGVSGWDFYEYYSAMLPKGRLKVILSDLYLNGETKEWTLDWQPNAGIIEQKPKPTEPIAVTVASETEGQPPLPYGISIVIDREAILPDGYIIYGNASWTDPIIQQYYLGAELASIKDANGNEIPFDYAYTGMHPQRGELRQYWAYKINQTNLSAPLTLSFSIVASIPVSNSPSFTFAPGANPQYGQKWDIRQDIAANGEIIHVLSAEYVTEGFFTFTMQSDSNIIAATIVDLQHPFPGGGGGGGGVPQAKAPFISAINYSLPLPQGTLTLTVERVGLLIPGDWTLAWSP